MDANEGDIPSRTSGTHHGTADGGDAVVECPLCVFSGTAQDVYRHLQTSHRKSELCREILVDAPQTQTSGD